jgi:hypothetical protein
VPGLRPPEVAPATEPDAPTAAAPSASAAARRRIALFVLVLLLAGGAAWGAGRLLSSTIEPAPADPHMNHQMMPGMPMSGMSM